MGSTEHKTLCPSLLKHKYVISITGISMVNICICL